MGRLIIFMGECTVLLAKQPDRKKWIEWICINLNIHEAAIASLDLFCSDHFNSGNIMKIRLKLGSVPELFVEPNINIVRDCIGGLVIMYLFYICNCLNLKPSVSNVAKAEYRSVLDHPNGNAVVIDVGCNDMGGLLLSTPLRVKLDTEDSELNNNSDDNSSVEEDKGSDEESNDEAGNISVEINSHESENEENRSEDEIVCRAEESFEANFEKESDDEIEFESRGQIPEFIDKNGTSRASAGAAPAQKKKKFQGRNMLDDSDDEDSGPGPENDHSDGSNTE
ncbi:Halomucin [Frankliniella fusca]|uniref:Halomucin n=1 Tax=Frankliniella fusca TaxID=407009 RepID=A0AAE1LMJ9_9NEOP|nr:Halomucin [Frankliniella fusca]